MNSPYLPPTSYAFVLKQFGFFIFLVWVFIFRPVFLYYSSNFIRPWRTKKILPLCSTVVTRVNKKRTKGSPRLQGWQGQCWAVVATHAQPSPSPQKGTVVEWALTWYRFFPDFTSEPQPQTSLWQLSQMIAHLQKHFTNLPLNSNGNHSFSQSPASTCFTVQRNQRSRQINTCETLGQKEWWLFYP